LALVGHPAQQVREPGPGFSSGLLPARKGVAIPGNARCAACRPRLTAAQGPRVERRAILARTQYATASRLRGRKACRGRRLPELDEVCYRPGADIQYACQGIACRIPGDSANDVWRDNAFVRWHHCEDRNAL